MTAFFLYVILTATLMLQVDCDRRPPGGYRENSSAAESFRGNNTAYPSSTHTLQKYIAKTLFTEFAQLFAHISSSWHPCGSEGIYVEFFGPFLAETMFRNCFGHF
jgi:hypothetical protein